MPEISKAFVVSAVTAAALLILLTRCTGEREPGVPAGTTVVADTLLTSAYPELYEAIYTRDGDTIAPYLDHERIEVRKQAWRALASTPIARLDPFIERAKRQKLEVAWFALSLHPFTSAQLRDLEQYWKDNPDRREGVSRILGEQGDARSLAFLFSMLDEAAGRSYEYAFALAVGKLMTGYTLEVEQQGRLLERAFSSHESPVTRAYLYGYYRGNIQPFPQELRRRMYDLWRAYGIGSSSPVDQYIAGILGGQVFGELTRYYSDLGLLESNVQLAVELGQSLLRMEPGAMDGEAVRILLRHENPHVVQQTLQSLGGKVEPGSDLVHFIRERLLASPEAEPVVWLQALHAVGTAEPGVLESYSERLDRTGDEHPYLLPSVLEIRRRLSPPDRFLETVAAIIDGGEPLRVLYGVQNLSDFWEELEEEQKTGERRRIVRSLVFEALGLRDRGIAASAEGLLTKPGLFGADDFARINRTLTAFRLPDDIEVFQAFGRVYRQRFERLARPVIDSLEGLGFASLNRSLARQGWDVAVPEEGGARVAFRRPDWRRLQELGRRPEWVLQTDKGVVRIRMNPLSAPATVSAIDSLTRAGAYDGIPFHRVVPNFVIQGGDVERRDGFGGPGFVIPTEAVETGFRRGAAGIASAGTDTEGSQYFIMHQWKPHLDGRYTLYGTVLEGMEVVDRIVAGDRVTRTYWEGAEDR